MEENQVELLLTRVEERAKSNSHRLDEVERRQENMDSLVQSVAKLATEQEHIQTDVKEIKTDVRSLKDRPAKCWNDLVDKAMWTVAAAVIAFLLGRLGL